MWQEIIVGVCVVCAALFLLRRWLPGTKKKSSACGGCGGCGTSANPTCATPAEKSPH